VAVESEVTDTIHETTDPEVIVGEFQPSATTTPADRRRPALSSLVTDDAR
jgi:hypothetical protein